MSDQLNGKPPTSFWVISATALIWNLIGVMTYYSQVTMTPAALEGFSPEQQAFFTSMPAWATAAYAIAVTAGVLGGLLLLLRKAWAVPAFAVSLAAIIVQDIHAFVLAGGIEVFGPGGAVIPAVVLVIGILLLWYSRSAKSKGWIS